jgi:DNA-binding CsgD family transcriptional regulator
LMRAAKTSRAARAPEDVQAIRQEIADFCRYLGARLNGDVQASSAPAIPANLKLSPRMRQTLDRLLAGDSEKQIAIKLGVSPHTVHVYVKSLYRGFDVNSRGELLARFVQVPRTHPNERTASGE